MEPNAFEREEKLEKLLASKTFDTLTPDERRLVLEEIGSEEEYHAMQRVSHALAKITDKVVPDREIIGSLQRMMGRNPSRSILSSLLAPRLPAYATVLLIILFSAIAWWAGGNRSGKRPRIVERIRIDTVYLASKVDTFYRERIIYHEVKKVSPPKRKVLKVADATPSEKTAKEVGISMKERQELEMLLVSGSE